MSKTQQIRDALANGPVSFRDLHLKIGGDDKKLADLCYYLRGKGEIKTARDDDRTVSLTNRRAPPQGKRKRTAGKKGKHMKRPFKKLAERVAERQNGSQDLAALVHDNYRLAGEQLRAAVRENVDGLDANPTLTTALANHERAEQIVNAARGL